MAYNKAAASALLLLFVAASVQTSAAMSCGQVDGFVSGCINYLCGRGPLTTACCNGVSNLNAAASSTPARQMACGCLKDAATKIPGINPNLAAGLPKKCGVNIPYAISTTTNCNAVH